MEQPSLPWNIPAECRRSAMRSMDPQRTTLRDKVYRMIAVAGRHGMTDEEIQQQGNLSGNTARPRRKELQDLGLIEAAPQKRKNRSGREATVWIKSRNAPA
jgi:predicted transcriptional regulator